MLEAFANIKEKMRVTLICTIHDLYPIIKPFIQAILCAPLKIQAPSSRFWFGC